MTSKLKNIVVAFTIFATTATYLFSDDTDTYRRSLAVSSEMTALDPVGARMQTSSSVQYNVDVDVSRKALSSSSSSAKSLQEVGTLRQKPTEIMGASHTLSGTRGGHVKTLVQDQTLQGTEGSIPSMKQQRSIKDAIRPDTDGIQGQRQASLMERGQVDVSQSSHRVQSRITSTSSTTAAQQVDNLRHAPTEVRRPAHSTSIFSGTTGSRSMTLAQDQTVQTSSTGNILPKLAAKNVTRPHVKIIEDQRQGLLADRSQVTTSGSSHGTTSATPDTSQLEQHAGNLRQVVIPAEARRASHASSILSGTTGARAMTMVQDQVNGAPTTNNILPESSESKLKKNLPLRKRKDTTENKVDMDEDHAEVLPNKMDKIEDKKELSEVHQKLLSIANAEDPLPGQAKVNQMMREIRAGRDKDDLTNKHTEKERFFKLMYGRSKPDRPES